MSSKALDSLIERVRAAREGRGSLAIRGAGTKSFYGEAVQGQLLDVRGLTGITRYEPSELVMTMRGGTPIAEVEAELARRNQYLAFEPPRYPDTERPGQRGGTVGGMVATGLSGPSRAAMGSVRDYVLGMTLLTGKAEVLTFGGQVMKNVAGYDVARMVTGSLGILGIICEVSLKVMPTPSYTSTLRFDCSEGEALDLMQRWAGQPLPINATAWWQGALVVRLSGATTAVAAANQKLGGEPIDNALAQRFWLGMRDQSDDFFVAARRALAEGAALWRISLPTGAPPLPLPGDQLIDWGGAQRWWITRETPARVRQIAHQFGGHATLFRARDKAAAASGLGVFSPLKPPLDRIHQELKQAFDPDGVFNPGRLYPGL
jgi:glycolate oxidase FAD binding subunit